MADSERRARRIQLAGYVGYPPAANRIRVHPEVIAEVTK